ncbi:MAG: CoA pyrophosphatase [Hyphomonadaceae bacterium]|nr:CoA pyrophosphatase [Hyphomonadaceae bacterium]
MKFETYLADPVIEQIKTGLEPLAFEDETYVARRDGQRPASVLMPLIPRSDEWHVLFTRRPLHMNNHAGQISFPGGRTEIGETPLDGALRETHEEVGIEADRIFPIGRLPSFNAVSQFRVTPYVGIVDPTVQIIPEPEEVDEAFELPFTFFMNPDNHIERRIEYNGEEHVLYDMPWPRHDEITHNVWGMTAMMMYRLYQRAFS